MPRFGPKQQRLWSPAKDSSPGMRTVDPKRIVLVRPWVGDRLACPCGCGEAPKGSKAVFAMGHDARLRGKLIRAHLTGTEVVYYRDPSGGDPIGPHSAMEVAEAYDWQRHLEAAVLKREGKNREVLQKALGSKRLVQVGRWQYTGQVAAVYGTGKVGEFEVEYVTKTGEKRTIRVPADEAPLAQEEDA